MKLTEVTSKSAMVKSALPETDYVVNPYSGCAFGCVYCYADFMRRFSGHLQDKWGEYVDVRVNIPELFEKELKNLINRINRERPSVSREGDTRNRAERSKAQRPSRSTFKGGKWPIIFFSSVTDPYQGAEAKYKLTRQCLEIVAENDFEGRIEILTKSHLVSRDVDILKEIKNVNIGLTITSTNDDVGRFFEKFAPPLSKRIEALQKLNEAGIQTYAFVSPLLPHYSANKGELEKIFKSIKDAGTSRVFVEHINLPPRRMGRLKSELKGKISNSMLELFSVSQTDEYKDALNEVVYELLEKYDLEILGGGIIDHRRVIGKGTEFVKK